MVGWAGSPTYAVPIKEVLAFHAENRAAVEIAVGLEALTLPLLLLFVTGLHGLVGRRGGAGADWSRLAVAAGATFSAVTAFYAVVWDGPQVRLRPHQDRGSDQAPRAAPGRRGRLDDRQ